MQLTIPTSEDIRAAVREELSAFFSTFQIQPTTEPDEIGKGAEFAAKVTGKAVQTIYDLCHKRLIPHSKCGKDLIFRRSELLTWLTENKRKTQTQLAAEAANYSINKNQNI